MFCDRGSSWTSSVLFYLIIFILISPETIDNLVVLIMQKVAINYLVIFSFSESNDMKRNSI